ncbi:MAG: regulatory iron-sulfur-containing complex subunit RicT [Phycisphaerae bacterium]
MVESVINLEQFDTEKAGERSHSGCAGCGGGGGGKGARCGNGLEKIYATTGVRFGYMRYIGEFTHAEDLKFTCGAKVVIQTKRGIEIGEQVSLTCGGCDKSVTRDQMREWTKRSGEDTYMFNAGRILREATAADLAESSIIQGSGREKRDFARDLARRHNLPIKIVDCESLFGGERIIFHFTAAERVDFRALVKDLAREYRTRIEMRQIGARDEARLQADYETCGREVCCKVFLKTLRPISMRMAKIQKATLDPTQVSGRCGRLKCCLRYEHVAYEELNKRLPKNGVRVRTAHGEGMVVNRQILTQLVQIRGDDGVLFTVVVEDITEVNVPPPQPSGDAGRPPSTAAGPYKRGKTRRPPPGRAGRKGRPPASDVPSSTPAGTATSETPEPGDATTTSDPTTAADAAEARDTTGQTPPDVRKPGRRRRRRRRRGGQGGGSGGEPPTAGG